MDNFNFKGNYKSHNTRGSLITYNKNDVVIYDGKSYIATKMLREISPAHGERGGWILFGGGSNSIQFYWGETPPVNANVGDEWFNVSTGKTYKYITDGNSEQWVNIY